MNDKAISEKEIVDKITEFLLSVTNDSNLLLILTGKIALQQATSRVVLKRYNLATKH